MNFHERKQRRADYYHRFVYGHKLRECSACAGSGYYDSNGSPACGSCDGTGRERYKAKSYSKESEANNVV